MPGLITMAAAEHGIVLPLVVGSVTENAVTSAAWNAMGSGAVNTILRGLLAGVPQDKVDELLSIPLTIYIPTSPPCPDMVLVDEHGEVRCVIEHKINALPNPTSVLRASRDGYLDVRPADLGLDGKSLKPHAWHDCQCGTDHLVSVRRDGRHSIAMWQIDTYRYTCGWLGQRSLNWRITEPAKVLWVLVDMRGRTAADIFRLTERQHPERLTARSADQWTTTSYEALIPALLAALPALSQGAAPVEEVKAFHGLLGKLSRVLERNGLVHLS